jgi:hypothetical protein
LPREIEADELHPWDIFKPLIGVVRSLLRYFLNVIGTHGVSVSEHDKIDSGRNGKSEEKELVKMGVLPIKFSDFRIYSLAPHIPMTTV